VIAFFNSEEHFDGGPLGSRYFVPIVKHDYENVWNINFDCVGISEDEVFLTGNSGSSSLSEKFTAFADGYGIIVDNNRPALSDSFNFTNMGIPSFNFLSADFMTTGAAHTDLDTPDRLDYQQIARVADMIVDFLSQSSVAVFEADELQIASTRPPLFDDADMEAFMAMYNRLTGVLDSLRAGDSVSFYEDFYIGFPEMEQRYFSFNEAVEIDGRLAHIRDFGNYRLEILENLSDPNDDNMALMYLHILDHNELDLRIAPLSQEDVETLLSQYSYQARSIPGLAGYSTLSQHGLYFWFLYSVGDISFIVTPSRLNTPSIENRGPGDSPPLEEMVSIISTFPRGTALIRDEDTYIELIKSLRFDEFLENWKAYTSH